MMRKEKTMIVEVTGPRCWVNDRHYLPGETATVPASIAREWIQTRRAVAVAAEVEDDEG